MSVKLVVVGKTDVGRVRTNNEDAFVVADLAGSSAIATDGNSVEFDMPAEGTMLAVSDGMGGEQAGEVASALVVESLRKELFDTKDVKGGEAFAELIDKAVLGANKEVFDASKQPGRRGMGATLTAVFLLKDTAFIAEVGDSRAYLIRAHRIRQMTRDQSFVQLLLDAGALSEDEAKTYPHKNVILQAMGQKPEVKAAIGKLTLRRFDRLLLCSDGLSNKLQDTEMREIVESSPSLDEACKRLIDQANERGGEDNITVVLAEVSGDDLEPHRGNESVTQTFEVVRAFTELDPKKSAPPRPAAGSAPPPAIEKAAKNKAEDDEPLPSTVRGGRNKRARPIQLVAALIIFGALLYVIYTILRDTR